MSSLHKFKAYFGMVPLEDFEDDYIDEPGQGRREYAEPGYASARRDDVDSDFDRYEPAPRRPISASNRSRRAESLRDRPEVHSRSTRGSIGSRAAAPPSTRAARCPRSRRSVPVTTARRAPSASVSVTARR